MTEPILSMQGICKAFGGITALEGAELTIRPGEVHGLIGQNGAGKSTLIKILNGAYRRDSGSVRVDGHEVTFRSPHEAQLGGVSTIFQEVNLVGYRSVAENIVTGREPRRWGMIDWAEAHRRAREVTRRFRLDIDVTRPLHRFNIAVQQLIAVARAVSFDARLVIMDEPTSSLDDQEKAALFEVIGGLKAEGVAILYVSHHLGELYEICDRVTVMRDGQMVATHEMGDVTKLDLVSEMIGRDATDVAAGGATGFADAGEAGREVILDVEHLSDGGVLHDASFLVHEGEIVGLAGLLGAGRSETARTIFGLRRPAQGHAKMPGKGVIADPAAAIRAGIGFCTEDRKDDGIVPELSIRENMTLAILPRLARRGVIPRKAERDLAQDFITKLGIKCASQDQPIRELSGGNQQKVLLSRWLAVEPDLLILDEPTRGIDVGAKREIQKLIDGLARSGMAILMISSEFEELVEGAHRVVVMQDGRTITEIARADLSEEAVMKAVAGPSAPHEAAHHGE